jgi:hypothetical protein
MIDALESKHDWLDRFALKVAKKNLRHGDQMPMMLFSAQIKGRSYSDQSEIRVLKVEEHFTLSRSCLKIKS